MWTRIKNFFKAIGKAVKELFTGKKQDVTTTTTTETKYDENGNIESVKVEVVEDPNNVTWKSLWKKAVTKVKNGLNDILEDPKKLFKIIGIGGVGGWSILSAVKALKETDNMIFGPIRKRKEHRELECRIYDDRTHLWYQLRRPLNPSEKNYITMQQRNGANMGDILARWRVLA